MSFRSLLDRWQQREAPALTAAEYAVRLPLDDAARLHALAELFPAFTKEQILSDLLTAALTELTASMPYIRGNKVISRDEHGDPIYEDAGYMPRFMDLTRKHRRKLAGAAKG